jgi:hypothetical protein
LNVAPQIMLRVRLIAVDKRGWTGPFFGSCLGRE